MWQGVYVGSILQGCIRVIVNDQRVKVRPEDELVQED